MAHLMIPDLVESRRWFQVALGFVAQDETVEATQESSEESSEEFHTVFLQNSQIQRVTSEGSGLILLPCLLMSPLGVTHSASGVFPK